MQRHQTPVKFKYRVLIVIYVSHLFLYIKFNNFLIYIYIYIYTYITIANLPLSLTDQKMFTSIGLIAKSWSSFNQKTIFNWIITEYELLYEWYFRYKIFTVFCTVNNKGANIIDQADVWYQCWVPKRRKNVSVSMSAKHQSIKVLWGSQIQT